MGWRGIIQVYVVMQKLIQIYILPASAMDWSRLLDP